MGKHCLQDTALRAPARPPMHILPVAKLFRQICHEYSRDIDTALPRQKAGYLAP
jgi:hypothetical protein